MQGVYTAVCMEVLTFPLTYSHHTLCIHRATTEFCVVVPIEEEDIEESGCSLPAEPPVRTQMGKRRSAGGGRDGQTHTVDIEEVNVPLPGTPTSDNAQEVPPTSSSLKGSGQLDIEQSHDSPDSPVSSLSFSSRGSTKSTDILLPADK